MAQDQIPVSGGAGGNSGGGQALPPGTIKRGRGRPPGSKTKAREVGDAGNAPRNPANDPIDPTFAADSAVAVLEIIDETCAAYLNRRVRRCLTAEHAADFDKMVDDSRWGDGELRLCHKSVAEIVRKHAWAAEYGPEILLAVLLTKHGAQQARLFAVARRVEIEWARRVKAANPPANPPAPEAPAPAPAPATPAQPETPKPAAP